MHLSLSRFLAADDQGVASCFRPVSCMHGGIGVQYIFRIWGRAYEAKQMKNAADGACHSCAVWSLSGSPSLEDFSV